MPLPVPCSVCLVCLCRLPSIKLLSPRLKDVGLWAAPHSLRGSPKAKRRPPVPSGRTHPRGWQVAGVWDTGGGVLAQTGTALAQGSGKVQIYPPGVMDRPRQAPAPAGLPGGKSGGERGVGRGGLVYTAFCWLCSCQGNSRVSFWKERKFLRVGFPALLQTDKASSCPEAGLLRACPHAGLRPQGAASLPIAPLSGEEAAGWLRGSVGEFDSRQ